MDWFRIIWLTAFFGPIAGGLVIFGVAVRAGYRIWPIWLIGLPMISILGGWLEGSWLGIPWADLIAGEAGHGGDAGGLGLLFLFFVDRHRMRCLEPRGNIRKLIQAGYRQLGRP
jgi:hypothetical protein